MKLIDEKKINVGIALVISILFLLGLSFVESTASLIFKNEAIVSMVAYIITTLFIFFAYNKTLKNKLKSFKDDLKNKKINIGIYTCIFLLAEIIINFIIFLFLKELASNETAVRASFFKNPIIMGINIVLLAPICEELIFRLPYTNSTNKRILNFIIYSLFFTVCHIAKVSNPLLLLYLIPYFLLSLALGYSFYKTNNIWASIIVHIANNLTGLLLLFI